MSSLCEADYEQLQEELEPHKFTSACESCNEPITICECGAWMGKDGEFFICSECPTPSCNFCGEPFNDSDIGLEDSKDLEADEEEEDFKYAV